MTQAGGLQKAVGSFGAAAKAKLNQGGQPEDQLRAPLEALFAARWNRRKADGNAFGLWCNDEIRSINVPTFANMENPTCR